MEILLPTTIDCELGSLYFGLIHALQYFCRIAASETIWRDAMHNYAASGDNTVLADGDPLEDDASHADPDIFLKRNILIDVRFPSVMAPVWRPCNVKIGVHYSDAWGQHAPCANPDSLGSGDDRTPCHAATVAKKDRRGTVESAQLAIEAVCRTAPP